MGSVWRVLLVAPELACYVALALLVATVGTLIVLKLTGACSQAGPDRIDCTSDTDHGIVFILDIVAGMASRS